MDKPWDIDIEVYADEAQLLAGLRAGDRMACTCLLKRYAPRLYRLALQLSGSADDAEDVLQESFIQACANIPSFEGRSSLGTWLHRIVRNTALMHLRRKRPDVQIDPDALDDVISTALPSDTRSEPDDTVLTRELREVVDHAVLALPATLRAAFVLRDIEGLSTQEAAAALEIGEPALKVRLHRARLALRQHLAPYLDNLGTPDEKEG